MDWTIDAEHFATFFLLTEAPALRGKFDQGRHVTAAGGIDFDAIEAECHAPSERALCRAARDLWNQTGDAPLWQLVLRLDDMNFDVLVEAMRLRRTWR